MLKKIISFMVIFILHHTSDGASLVVQNKQPLEIEHNGSLYQVEVQEFLAECENGFCTVELSDFFIKLPYKYFYKVVYDEESETEATTTTCTSCSAGKQNNVENLQTVINSQPFISPAVGRLSSKFGIRRDPMTGRKTKHNGVDIAAPGGTTIVNSKNGYVETVINNCKKGTRKCGGGYGNYIIINHGDGTKTRYAHLNETCNIKWPAKNQMLKQGEAIGCVGTTGKSTGNHLHFELIVNGTPEDPELYINFRR